MASEGDPGTKFRATLPRQVCSAQMGFPNWSQSLLKRQLPSAMNWFQAIADIRQHAPNDDAHGVIQIQSAHLLLEVGGHGFFGESQVGYTGRKELEFARFKPPSVSRWLPKKSKIPAAKTAHRKPLGSHFKSIGDSTTRTGENDPPGPH